MKRILYVLAICLAASVYSCKNSDSSKASDASAIEKAKQDSASKELLKQANDMNAPDSGHAKKDSTNKTKK